jgi:glucose/arabinose dehydrogenase
MPRRRPAVIAAAGCLVLAACGSYDTSTPPTWQPSPVLGPNNGGPGAQASPIVPVPEPSGGAGNGPGGAPSSPSGKRRDPNVVATHLSSPVGLTMLPSGAALVGERTTGRIVRVQPRPGQPVPTIRTLPGLDTSGDGGLLDLALSPTYAEDGLIYAYVTTATDNRVVDFTMKGPVTPVVTGIPKGRTGNTGRIVFGADGNLYIGTGDAGRPALAARATSLAGKVLRVDDIGDPTDGNPRAASPVWTSGHHDVDGICPIPRTSFVLEVERGADGARGEVNSLRRGAFYGWPSTSTRTAVRPSARMPTAARVPGDCAVLGNRVWVTSLDGQELLSARLRTIGGPPTPGAFTAELKNRYGRLKTVVAAPDGALWLTTSNKDGLGHPVAADERVIRYIPSASGGQSPA